METQKELDYCVFSLQGKIYHIALPEIKEGQALCRQKFTTTSTQLPIILGKSPLVSLANLVWPQIPRPGVLCKQCLRQLTQLHDKHHISDEAYEKLVFAQLQDFYASQGKQVLKAKQGRNNLWIGQSGCKHQVDVSLEFENEIVLAECKCFYKPVELPLVLTFLARVMDIKPAFPNKLVHGFIFSNVSFQGGSEGNIQKLADYYQDYISLRVLYSYGWPSEPSKDNAQTLEPSE